MTDAAPSRPSARGAWAQGSAALYVALVLYSGTRDAGPALLPFHWGDKLMHALAFAGMQTSLWWALRSRYPGWSRRRGLLVALGMSVAVGGLLECVQALLPYRSAEWGDLIADSVGAALAAALLALAGRRGRPSAGVP